MPESPLIAFYRGTGTDHAGRRLVDVLAWDDAELEAVHDYIQWLFPNVEPSRANSFAPLLTPADIATFRGDPTLQSTLLQSFERLLRFYGYRRSDSGEGGLAIEPSADWETHATNWLQPYNHNHLRLTRIMKCLTALGLEAEARALQRALLETASRHMRLVSRTTLRYWTDAVS